MVASIEQVAELARMTPEADHHGALHLAVDDGNLDDEALSFCESEPSLKPEERALVGHLRKFTKEERETAYVLSLRPSGQPAELPERPRPYALEWETPGQGEGWWEIVRTSDRRVIAKLDVGLWQKARLMVDALNRLSRDEQMQARLAEFERLCCCSATWKISTRGDRSRAGGLILSGPRGALHSGVLLPRRSTPAVAPLLVGPLHPTSCGRMHRGQP
jgi:hypothetical protein